MKLAQQFVGGNTIKALFNLLPEETMKTTSMFAALTAILSAQKFYEPHHAGSGLTVPFSVEPVTKANWREYVANQELEIPMEHLELQPANQISVCEVIGGGEAWLGMIYHVCDSQGGNVATYYAH